MGAFAPFIGPAISAAANIGGGFLSAGSAAANNASQLAMLQQQQQFQSNVNDATWAHDQSMAQFNWNNQQQQNQFNWNAMTEAQGYNASEAQKNRDFQQYMANTSYQRAMGDMKAAGLNPILAYQQGGAPVPSGSAASSPMASATTPTGSSHAGSGTSLGYSPQNTGAEIARGISNAVSSATDAAKTYAGVDLMNEQSKTQGKIRDKTEQDTHTSSAQETNAIADTVKKAEETRKTAAETEGQRIQNEIYKTQSGITAKQLDDMNRYGSQYTPGWFERLTRTIQGATEAIPPPATLPPPSWPFTK